MDCAILATVILLSPQEAEEPSCKFKKGTAWIYESTRKGETAVIILVVAKDKEDGVALNVEFYKDGENKPYHVSPVEWTLKDGTLWGGIVFPMYYWPAVPMYRVGSKKGDTWTASTGEGSFKLECKGTHEGRVPLDVPAGRYKNVVHTRVEEGGIRTYHFYFVPQVGIIRFDFGEDGVWKLREITERKEVKLAKPEQMQANERLAVRCLRNLATAEADFRANDRDANQIQDYWVGDVSGLYRILDREREKVIFLIEKETAEADAAPLDLEFMARHTVARPVSRGGYLFRAVERDARGNDFDCGSHRHPSHFAFCAYPAQYGTTGESTFIISDQSPFVFKGGPKEVLGRDLGGRPARAWPSDDELTGLWNKVD